MGQHPRHVVSWPFNLNPQPHISLDLSDNDSRISRAFRRRLRVRTLGTLLIALPLDFRGNSRGLPMEVCADLCKKAGSSDAA